MNLYKPEIEARVLLALMMIESASNPLAIEALTRLTKDCFFGSMTSFLYMDLYKRYTLNQNFGIVDMQSSDPSCWIEKNLNNRSFGATLLTDIEELHKLHNLRISHKMIADCMQNLNLINNSDQKLESVYNLSQQLMDCESLVKDELTDLNTHALEYLNSLSEQSNIIPSGLRNLDKLLEGGFEQGSLITIAGISGTGKTSFGVKLAYEIASQKKDKQGMIFTLEVSKKEIAKKNLAAVAKSAHFDRWNPEQQLSIIETMNKTSFQICDKSPISIDHIEKLVRLATMRKPLSVVLIDFLDYISHPTFGNEQRWLQINDICRRLSVLASRNNCLIILLSQLNRNNSSRADKRPITTDAASAMGSVTSSSYWFGLHREDLYSQEMQGVCELILRKNRFRGTGTVFFDFNNALFTDTDQQICNNKLNSVKSKKYTPFEKEDIFT